MYNNTFQKYVLSAYGVPSTTLGERNRDIITFQAPHKEFSTKKKKKHTCKQLLQITCLLYYNMLTCNMLWEIECQKNLCRWKRNALKRGLMWNWVVRDNHLSSAPVGEGNCIVEREGKLMQRHWGGKKHSLFGEFPRVICYYSPGQVSKSCWSEIRGWGGT